MSLQGFVTGKKIEGPPQFFGKYRATVTKNKDPKLMGRLRVSCPKVLGAAESGWCLPCLPPGFKAIPKVGALVWIEFEGGDINYPIWTGVWFAEKGYAIKEEDVEMTTGTNGRIFLGGGANAKAVARKEDTIDAETGKITGGSTIVFAK